MLVRAQYTAQKYSLQAKYCVAVGPLSLQECQLHLPAFESSCTAPARTHTHAHTHTPLHVHSSVLHKLTY